MALLNHRATVAVLSDVAEERGRQDNKWGQQDHDPGTWMEIAIEELGEASRESLHVRFEGGGSRTAWRSELVQAAAVIVQMIECGDRNGWFADRAGAPGAQRYAVAEHHVGFDAVRAEKASKLYLEKLEAAARDAIEYLEDGAGSGLEERDVLRQLLSLVGPPRPAGAEEADRG